MEEGEEDDDDDDIDALSSSASKAKFEQTTCTVHALTIVITYHSVDGLNNDVVVDYERSIVDVE